MLTPANPDFAQRVRDSFQLQNAMHLIQARLEQVTPGNVTIVLPHWTGVEQQHGFIHGGVVGMIADSAAGYAAMSLVSADASVLTVEYKLNLVAPADGDRLIARGKVVRPGKTLSITQAEVLAERNGQEILCALMQQTIMVMRGKSEKPDQAARTSKPLTTN
ncbi:PaaI family thioesterase [Dechloromonas sp. ZY10]|uniref:PaaI family thioesterase n=1 Tax=Dechloromonas aquae TaxID=2664436 RepID=UPI003528B73A